MGSGHTSSAPEAPVLHPKNVVFTARQYVPASTDIYSEREPIRRRSHGYILMACQSDAEITGIFSYRHK
eukprot:3010916-Pyramimonas_sp.AAC.2